MVTELGRRSTGKLQFDDNFDIFTLMEPFEGSLMGHLSGLDVIIYFNKISFPLNDLSITRPFGHLVMSFFSEFNHF